MRHRPWSVRCGLGVAAWFTLALGGTARADDVRQVPLVSNDLAYCPTTGQIYASIPGSQGAAGNGNSITAVDPVVGTVGPSVFVGSEPGRLAVSDDGQFVYVALIGSSVGRFNTAAGTEDLTFSLGSPLSVDDMTVLPGLPHSLAVSKQDRRYSPRTAGTFVYDDGVERPNSSAGNNSITAASSTLLYGYNNESSSFDFTTLAVDSTGVTRTSDNQSVISGAYLSIRYDNGLVFGSNATEIDPKAQTVLGTFSGGGYNTPFVPDAKIGRIFFLTGSGGTLSLLAFDTKTFLQVGSLSVPGVSGSPGSLIRWGANGLAFRTSGGQLFLIRTSLITAAQPVSVTLSPAQTAGGAATTGTVTLAAPAPAGGVTVLLSSDNAAVAAVPDLLTLPAGQTSATFPVTTQPVTTATPVHVSAASSGVRVTGALTVQPAQSPPVTHLLWSNTDKRAMFWNVNADGSFTVAGGYGPYTDGGDPNALWTATALATGPDGVSHILWNNTDHRVMLWNVQTNGSFQVIGGYGPYTDDSQPGGPSNLWSCVGLSVGPDNVMHLIWGNVDHRAMFWDVGQKGSFSVLAGYGPYTDDTPSHVWDVTGVSTGPDNVSHLLWSNSDRRAMFWDVSNADGSFSVKGGYGPYTDNAPNNLWGAVGVSTGPDNVSHLLWNNTDLRAMFWDVSNGDGAFSVLNGYGPYTDNAPQNKWSVTGLATGSDNVTHLLWNNSDYRAMLWRLDGSGGIGSVYGYGPYTDDTPQHLWSAVGVSAGP